ncbi:MAG TPA: PRC-barrel domain-containing protein [Vicinamibacterales bacterium]|nr:PRC-barrel domain-containing protein [Vicinamibacterales bacterium]
MAEQARLRYVDADEVGSEIVDFDRLKVRTPGGEKLGEVDGFILDDGARRAYYVVVDSGGWFRSRKFLVPVGHARIDADGDALVLDIARDTISRYPEFDERNFERLGSDELRRYEQQYGLACCPEDVPAGAEWNYESYDHYRQPEWWRAEYYNWDVPAAIGTTGTLPSRAVPSELDRAPRSDERTHGRHTDDESPHLDGRAQPGDVLGVETGGETTALGDTGDDEDRRRQNAERTADKQGGDVRTRRRE